MQPWPAESTKRSRSNQAGFAGLKRRNSSKRTCPSGAQPMGRPGCPDCAFSTASTARNRIVFTDCSTSSGSAGRLVLARSAVVSRAAEEAKGGREQAEERRRRRTPRPEPGAGAAAAGAGVVEAGVTMVAGRCFSVSHASRGHAINEEEGHQSMRRWRTGVTPARNNVVGPAWKQLN